MKKIFLILAILFVASSTYAQTTVNGLLDSTVSVTAAGSNFSFGVEEYANIRFQSRLRDNRAVVYGAVNLIAAAGDYAENARLLENLMPNSTPYYYGENYIAGIELERLYFRLNFEKANFDAGLFRLPFGYSHVWGSLDFLNPKNPLKPDARPRGVLGAAIGIFPAGDLKIGVFAVTGRDPFLNDGSGLLCGTFIENHWSRISAQALYSYEMRNTGSYFGIHRAGFSVKADIEVGLIIDALYTYNHEAKTKLDGLSFSAGADYSFIDGKLIVLAEYLYNGENSSTASSAANILGMPNRHYIYSGFTWLFSDFTNVNIALISCLDKTSFIPVVSFNHDLFQGASLLIMAQADFKQEMYMCSARLRLRF